MDVFIDAGSMSLIALKWLCLTFLCYLQYIPPQLRLSGSDVTAAAMWGGTAVIGAIWLVQVSLQIARKPLMVSVKVGSYFYLC